MNTPNPISDNASEVQPTDNEALKAEVNKWQERVPRLASALRHRTEVLAAARDQIRGLQQQPSGAVQEVDTRLKTRDGLIKELEEKLAKLTENHLKHSGEMHGVELGRQAAQEDLAEWKGKWQQVSESLDGEASQRAALQAQLNILREKQTQSNEEHESALSELTLHNTEEKISLARRNEQLIESMKLANKKIVTLGEELSQLITRVEAEKSSRQTAEAALTESQAQTQEQTTKLNGFEAHASEQQKASMVSEDDLQIQLEEMQNRLDSLSQEQLQDQAEWVQRLAAKDQQQLTLEQTLSEAESQNRAASQTLEEARETLRVQSTDQQQRIEAQQREITTFSSELASQSEEIVRLEK